ncbi:MAG: ABC transporter ATP-binding protein [bacterium]
MKFGTFTAVNKITLEVGTGEIFGFLGPNGAGKSTTIRMLCGILTPTSGEGRVAGFDVMREPEKIKKHIGYMSQRFSLYEDLTVEENIDFYGGIYGLNGGKHVERKEWAIEMAGLSAHRKKRAKTLAGGWKQRLALGCAILHEPPVIFLDEPTSGVDPLTRRRFWDVIYELAERGTTVFVTTHYMDEAEFCDRVALIYRGELIAVGAPSELKKTAMSHSIIEVACARPQDFIGEIEQLPSVSEAALFGSGLHVTTDDADRAAAEIRRFFEARIVPTGKIEKVAPSMEDVFVSLIEARDKRENDNREVER